MAHLRSSSSISAVLTLLLLTGCISQLSNAAGIKDCEVCQKVLEEVVKRTEADLSQDNIEKAFIDYCSETEIAVEERFCYYLGGSKDSATRTLSAFSKPLSWTKPVDKVCEGLVKLNDQICKLRYEVQVDISNVNLKTLRVRELRKILSSWNARCDGCIEKEEFIQRIEELKPQFVKSAATAAKEDL